MQTYFKHDMTTRAQARAEKRRAKTLLERRVYAQVDTRDAGHCRACLKRIVGQRHHHHLRFRSQLGETSTRNVLLLCPVCHTEVHVHRLRIEALSEAGADGRLRVRRER